MKLDISDELLSTEIQEKEKKKEKEKEKSDEETTESESEKEENHKRKKARKEVFINYETVNNFYSEQKE